MMGMKSNQELNDVTGRKLLYRVYRKTHQQNCWILFVTTIFKLGPASWPNKSLLLLLEYNGY